MSDVSSNLIFEVYRNEGANGTTKDWMIAISNNPGIVIVKYGRTGQKLRTSITKTTMPSTEMRNRISEKVSKGYYYIGQSSECSPETLIINANQFDEDLMWSIDEIDDLDDFKAKAKGLCERLHYLNLPQEWAYDLDVFSVSSRSVIDLTSSFSVSGRMTPSGKVRDYRVGGKAKRLDPLPIMFLLAMAQNDGKISFCDSDSEPVEVEYTGLEHRYVNNDYSVELLSDLAVALELKKSVINWPVKSSKPGLLQLHL